MVCIRIVYKSLALILVSYENLTPNLHLYHKFYHSGCKYLLARTIKTVTKFNNFSKNSSPSLGAYIVLAIFMCSGKVCIIETFVRYFYSVPTHKPISKSQLKPLSKSFSSLYYSLCPHVVNEANRGTQIQKKRGRAIEFMVWLEKYVQACVQEGYGVTQLLELSFIILSNTKDCILQTIFLPHCLYRSVIVLTNVNVYRRRVLDWLLNAVNHRV